jgi:hypothetical protein
MDDEIRGMYDLLDAIEGVIKSADPTRRASLAQIIDAYSESFPEDFFWAVGPQSPALLNHILTTIDAACRVDTQSKPRVALRLVGSKLEGSS